MRGKLQRIFWVLALVCAGTGLFAGDYTPRVWTNSIGVKREATFVRAEGNDVTLLLNNGQLVTMPLDRFSPEDQEYVHQIEMRAMGVAVQQQAAQANGTDSATTAAPPSQAPAPQPGVAASGTKRPSLLLRKPPLHAPDPSVQPGAELHLAFPELGKSRTDEPLGMYIRIPENYRPDRPVPLIVWMAGGDGSSRFNEALNFVPKEDFILVGINYPSNPVPAPNEASRTGHIDEVWKYQERMLARLQDLIPNTDPRLRIAVGFSNGAHTIGGCLAQGEEGFYGYFNVYVLIEGGVSDKYEYPRLPGRYYYVSWGDASVGGRGPGFGQTLADAAKRAGMIVEAHAMPAGVGHDFPDYEKAKVRAWLQGVTAAQLGK